MSKKVEIPVKLKLVRKPDRPPAPSAPEELEVYSFPSRSKCPRCGSYATRRTGSYKDTQYRECKAPICGKKYSIMGTKL